MNESTVLSALLTSPSVVAVGTARDGTITTWSAGAAGLYGWCEQEALGRSVQLIVPPDRRAEVEELERRALDGEPVPPVETVGRSKDGARIDVALHLVPLRDEQQRVVGLLRVHSDLRAVRRAQAAVHSAEDGAAGFVDVPVAQSRTAPDGRVLAVNPAMELLLGRPADELVGVDGLDLLLDDDRVAAAAVLQRLADGVDHYARRELTVQRPDGESRRVFATTTPVRAADGTLTLVTSMEDVTALRTAQEDARVTAERFDALVQTMPVAVFTYDLDAVCTSSRGAALRHLGLADDELVGRDLLAEYSSAESRASFLATLAGESATQHSEVGDRMWETHYRPVRDAAGAVVGGIGIALDRTERAAAERDVASNEARLRALLRNADDVVLVLDESGRMLFVSPAMPRVFGHEPAALFWRVATDYHHPDDRPAVAIAWRRVLLRPGRTATCTVRIRHADGSWRECDHVLTNLLHDPDIAGVVVNLRDVTARRAAEAELQRLALHDGLTGLANRALLLDRIGQAMAWARRNDTQSGVVALDVVGMGAVNAAVGQDGGDAVLRAVAERLLAAVRGTDSVARLGGDHFAVLVEDVGSAEDLRTRAATLREAAEGEVAVGGLTVRIGLRAGSAATPAADPGALLQAAERALSSRSPGAAVPSAAVAGDDDPEGAAAVAELRDAIADGQLRLHFQPIIDLADSRVVGAEALVRWEHPERGLLPPSAFIPLAETSGVVGELGSWVLRAACAQAAAWHAAGLPYSVGANLSPRQLVGGDVVHLVRGLLEQTGTPPDRLVLEVTESALMDDPGAPKTLLALRELGVRLALDDFGTGYSSLTYLKRFAVDAIKIDRSFVSGLGRDPDDEAIVASVVSLARAIGKLVVAEGVETTSQLAALRALGVDRAQGFLWSPALPVAELDGWLARRLQDGVGQAPPAAPLPTPAVVAGPGDVERRILQLHQRGASLHTIAAALNAEGRRTTAGPRWTTTSVARVIAALTRAG